LFLGLTGKTCNARDMMELGLATHYLPSEWILKAKKEYIENGNINTSSYYPEMPSDILKNENFIEDVFQGPLEEIINKLKNSKNEFGQKIYSHLLTRCPMSLAVTTKLIELGKSKTLRECLSIEYQLSQHMAYRDDFNNGVNSVLISKNYNPQWKPSTIIEINNDKLKAGGCKHCEYNDNPYALQYHHLDPTKKIKNVSGYYRTSFNQLRKMREEAKGCIVLCANCHLIEEQRIRDEN